MMAFTVPAAPDEDHRIRRGICGRSWGRRGSIRTYFKYWGMSMILLALLGPISSGSQKGQGPFFSGLFILVGTWMLVGTWKDYLRRPDGRKILPFNIIALSALAVFFIGSGIWGLVR
jgi:hypothetical protein